MTNEQRSRAVAFLGRKVEKLLRQAEGYRALAASNEGERQLNEAGARNCEDDADALSAALNELIP